MGSLCKVFEAVRFPIALDGYAADPVGSTNNGPTLDPTHGSYEHVGVNFGGASRRTAP